MSRMDRLAQLSHLENLIESKKKEIQAKLEAQKKKETEKALMKIQNASSSRRFWQKKNESKPPEPAPVAPVHFSNVFSNDGSFLDQFKKLSKSGLKPEKVDVETLAKAREAEEKEKERRKNVDEEKTQRQIERNMRERERELRKLERNRERDYYDCDRHGSRSSHSSGQEPRERSPKRAPLDSNIKLDLPPPGVVQLIPQVQILAPVVITSMPQLVLNPQPVQPFTTNEIQLQAAGLAVPNPPMPLVPPIPPPSLINLPSQLPLAPPISQHMVSSQPVPQMTPVITIPPPLPMTPQSIPPPSPMQVDKIPPPPSPPQMGRSSELFGRKRKRRGQVISSCAPPPQDYCDEIPLPTSSPLPNQVPPALRRSRFSLSSSLDSGARHLAKMVATNGDHAEEILRVAHKDDPALRNRHVDESDPESRHESDDDSAVNESEKYDPADADYSSSDDSISYKKKAGEEKYDPADCQSDSDDAVPSRSIKKEADVFKIKKEEAFDLENKHIPLPIDQTVKKEEIDNAGYEDRPSFSIGAELGIKTEVPFGKSEPEQPRKRKSRWGEKAVLPPGEVPIAAPQVLGLPGNLDTHVPPVQLLPASSTVAPEQVMLSQVTRKDPGLLAYARQTFGSLNLSEEDWKRAEDHYKINILYQNMMKKREELDKLARAGKFKYEYDSDEDTEGGTWEHKLRNQEMTATQQWADELTRQAEGKHHIGDFLPPEELDRFMEKYNAVKSGREPDLSDYKEFKLKEDNVGFKLLQKMGWSEGQGLGQEGQGIVNPVNKATTRMENQGLGLERPDGVGADDDEYDAYRKRMMLAYRFRPNPLNNPRRPYY